MVARRLGAPLTTTLECLPALMLAWLCLRVAESWHAELAGLRVSVLFGPALANDLLALARHGFVFLVGGLVLAPMSSRRRRVLALGVLWSLLLAAEAGLVAYHWAAGAPLGADLFGYSRAEIATTLGGRTGIKPVLGAGLAAALAVLWTLLLASGRAWWPRASLRSASLLLACSVAAWFVVPEHFAPPAADTEAGVDYLRNKMAFFVDRSAAHVLGEGGGAQAGADAQANLPWSGKDARHPFLHADRTPDTLGPLFDVKPGAPPNLVFIVVEGLGRDFSGPGARLGSFTPFLDELARRSLYFENFLSGQGRTFGVLSTLFASMPFGENGMEALGSRIPRHQSLLGILKGQGYHLNYYGGSNLDFDNQGLFLRGEGVDTLVSEQDYGPPHERSNYWGYADRDLVEMALQREAADTRTPRLSIIQTASMHDPFTFPGQARYLDKVDKRLAELGIPKGANPAYGAQPEIFASILYTDDALREYFEQASKLPGYANTIFIITGDHRLPELPMDTRIERYHVPLIVYSPLLKKPASIKAVSSQFDVAPSLLAFLGHGYGLRVPLDAAWLGTGLDLDPGFRNLHVIPLKQTKTELSDFVSGTVYLAQDRLYALADGLQLDRSIDEAALARARAQFQSFQAANRVAGKAEALAPAGALASLSAWRGANRGLDGVALASTAGQVGVSGVHRRPGAGGPAGEPAGDPIIEASFTNAGQAPSSPFVPLLVISDAGGLELAETAGAAQTLAPGARVTVALPARLGKLPHGTYFVSVIPSHPDSGRSTGIGQYHVEMKL
jgi:arylsulfatase A-like enzyme